MRKFKDNLYLLTAISYFLDNESEIDLGKYNIKVFGVKNDYYCPYLVEEEIPSISFWVGISDNNSSNDLVYQTKFYKPTSINVEVLKNISEDDKMRFVMEPVKTISDTPYLSKSYLSIFLTQSAGGLPVEEDYMSCTNPSREIQAEVAKKLKEKLYKFSDNSISDYQFTK